MAKYPGSDDPSVRFFVTDDADFEQSCGFDVLDRKISADGYPQAIASFYSYDDAQAYADWRNSQAEQSSITK